MENVKQIATSLAAAELVLKQAQAQLFAMALSGNAAARLRCRYAVEVAKQDRDQFESEFHAAVAQWAEEQAA